MHGGMLYATSHGIFLTRVTFYALTQSNLQNLQFWLSAFLKGTSKYFFANRLGNSKQQFYTGHSNVNGILRVKLQQRPAVQTTSNLTVNELHENIQHNRHFC